MRIITVVTAVLPSKADHLADAYRSLHSQALPAGWEWEWLVQEDGAKQVLDLPRDDRISHVANGRISGTAGTRNLALARAKGDCVRILDADDYLPAGALARDIDVLDTHPEVAWTTSGALDVSPDGSLTGSELDPAEGTIAIGSLLDRWRADNHRLTVHPATLCVRAEHLWAVGGWMGLPAGEDTALLLGLNALWPGWFTPTPGLVYRKWGGQTTAEATYRAAGFESARFEAIERRVRAMQLLIAGRSN